MDVKLKMKTYYFTIAKGTEYLSQFQDLKKSATKNSVNVINIIDSIEGKDKYGIYEQGSIKIHKINGILNAPSGYDRIVYIDSDTLINNLDGINQENGALKEPWGMGKVPHVVEKGSFFARQKRKSRLFKLLEKNKLDVFCPGGKLYLQEWNSGVIIGDRRFMEELAQEWYKWWLLVQEINDGIFRRDQMSFKYAYKRIAIDKYGYETIDPVYNWIVKRFGYSKYAKIYHKAGGYTADNENTWNTIRERIIK